MTSRNLQSTVPYEIPLNTALWILYGVLCFFVIVISLPIVLLGKDSAVSPFCDLRAIVCIFLKMTWYNVSKMT